ncbi:MAG: hypothetical protein ACXW61_14295, partial [Gemmatirosa sp.]
MIPAFAGTATGMTRRASKSTTWYVPRVFVRHTRTEPWNRSALRSSGASSKSSTAIARPRSSTSTLAGTSTVAAPVSTSTRTSSVPCPPAGVRASTYERPSRIQRRPGAPAGASSRPPKMRSTVRRRGSPDAAAGAGCCAPSDATSGDATAGASAAAATAATR